jgi:hypothetical protein
MFVHRSPFPRNYHYSHPLAGKNYHNSLYLQHAHDEESTNQSEVQDSSRGMNWTEKI